LARPKLHAARLRKETAKRLLLSSDSENDQIRKTTKKTLERETEWTGWLSNRLGSCRYMHGLLHVISNVAGAGEADSLFEQNGGIFHFPFIQMCQSLEVMIRDVTG
jgi:hypothetical protein